MESKLKSYLNKAKYRYQDSTKVDVLSITSQYLGLHIKLEPFVFENGHKKDLIAIEGTIPVRYKGNVYNIPICIWLTDTHPHNAPICYVKPTPDMRIKVSKYVDFNGKIYLPYLHEWDPSKYNLIGLVQVMIITFGEQPPVYSKPKQQGTEQQAQPPYPVSPAAVTTTSSGYPPASTAAAAAYPPYPTNSTGSGSGYPTTTTSSSGTITEEHIRASLISAVEDKLKRRLREQYSQKTAELETLKRTNEDLLKGKDKLEDIMRVIEKETHDVDKTIASLEEREAELDKTLSKLELQQPIDFDEAITTTTPLYKQLLNVFAEESATEDAIYYLGEALRQGVIDLEVFLKQVRTLSRKQFMLRALTQRCRQKAGLAG